MSHLSIEIPEYTTASDPTKIESTVQNEWNIMKININEMKSMHSIHTRKFKRIKLDKKIKKEENTVVKQEETIPKDENVETSNPNIEKHLNEVTAI